MNKRSTASMPSILVVGGAGYIGSHMVAMLAEHGYSVSVFDNLSRGHRDACRGTPLIEGDLRNLSDLNACFEQHHFDVVMHFAALAYVGESVENPELYYENNVLGSLNLLKALRARSIKRFVFSSTCATYGIPQLIPITEAAPQLPINPYGFSKLVIEHALADYGLAYGLNSVSLRYFNAAGCDPSGKLGERHEPETHLIPLVLQEALRLKQGGRANETTLKVFGDDFETSDGSCVRDYVHVNDLCSAHLLATQRLLGNETLGAEFFNLANESGYSVFDVINACRQVTGQPIEYVIADRRSGDPAILIGDATKAKQILGWQPKNPSLIDIVSTAWAWMISQT
jgi:UDP-glucose-4-epimerase GalE